VTTNSVVVVWRTEGRSDPQVRYGEEAGNPQANVNGAAIVRRTTRSRRLPLHSAPPGTVQYEALITGLSADREYAYVVQDGRRVLAGPDSGCVFRTAPAKATAAPLRFWVLGDSGTADANASNVCAAMRAYTGTRPPDLLLHVGDMAYYDGKDEEFQRAFFNMYPETLRSTACWPAVGNHEGHSSEAETEVGPYYDAYMVPRNGEAGGVPSGTESYYSFQHGNVRFISLNSYDVDRRRDGPMGRWLEHELSDLSGVDWLIAYWHHAVYSKGTHDSDTETQMVEMREQIVPLLEAAGVDLVFTGHSHLYERTMLLDGAYATPTTAQGVVLDDGNGDPSGDGAYRKSAGLRPNQGAVYAVVGNGGGAMFRREISPVIRVSQMEYGSLVVDIEGDTLTAMMIDTNAAVRDCFQIVKRGSVSPQRIARPWSPIGPRILPETPYFHQGVAVRLESVTGWPGEKLLYTLDGSEPDATSLVFTGAFLVATATTVRARSLQPDTGRLGVGSARAYLPFEGVWPEPLGDLRRAGLEPGVRYRLYHGAWKLLPEFEALPVAGAGTSATIGPEPADVDDEFGLVFEGYFLALRDGVYAFHLESDDGSRLFIGGVPVIQHDGLHPAREVTGYAGLRAGFHPLRVEYFDRLEAQVLRLSYSAPGIERQAVEGDLLWRDTP